jgi:anti-sigma factor RsiW
MARVSGPEKIEGTSQGTSVIAMTSDDRFEYLLSQYLDGQLSPAERAFVESQLAQDSNAWETLREYSEIDALLRTPMPMPEIDWQDHAAKISAAIAEIPQPARSIPLFRPPIFRPWIAALAACLLLGISLVLDLRSQQPKTSAPQRPTDEVARADVTGPLIQPAGGDSLADVTLDSQPSEPQSPVEFADPVVTQPSRVSIISAVYQPDRSPEWEPK